MGWMYGVSACVNRQNRVGSSANNYENGADRYCGIGIISYTTSLHKQNLLEINFTHAIIGNVD